MDNSTEEAVSLILQYLVNKSKAFRAHNSLSEGISKKQNSKDKIEKKNSDLLEKIEKKNSDLLEKIEQKISKDSAGKIAMPLIKALSNNMQKSLNQEREAEDKDHEELYLDKEKEKENKVEEIKKNSFQEDEILTVYDIEDPDSLAKEIYKRNEKKKKLNLFKFLQILLGIKSNTEQINLKETIDKNPDLEKFLEQNNIKIKKLLQNASSIEFELNKQIKAAEKNEATFFKKLFDPLIDSAKSINGIDDIFKNINNEQKLNLNVENTKNLNNDFQDLINQNDKSGREI